MERSAYDLVTNIAHERSAQNEVMPRVRLPESPESDVAALFTHGQQMLYGHADSMGSTHKIEEKPMNNYLRTDQYTYIDPSCPLWTDLHPADDCVEITIGDHRFGSDTLRLLLHDPDTCDRLAQVMSEARNRLVSHLRVKACPDPALSQLDKTSTAPIAS